MFESLHYLLESSLIVRIYLAKFESYQIKDKMLIRIISGYFKSRRYRRLLKFASTLARLVHLLIHLQVHLDVHLVNLHETAPGFVPDNNRHNLTKYTI